MMKLNRDEIFEMINKERSRQNNKWGFPQKKLLTSWGCVLAEESGELCSALNNVEDSNIIDLDNIIEEAIQVAAVAVSIIEHLPFSLELSENKYKEINDEISKS